MILISLVMPRYVFPAPAGMNRAICCDLALILRVPRACGDEPVIQGNKILIQRCSPRLRG